MKEKLVYKCSECGSVYPKWVGRCAGCDSWNTLEEAVKGAVPQKWLDAGSGVDVVRLSDVVIGDDRSRFTTGIDELDRVLGGGIVPGSVVLIGGDPGIGKSTLILQALNNIATEREAIYVCGEESPAQIKLRAIRLKSGAENLFLYPETNIEMVIEMAKKKRPALLVIDSIQTVYSQDSDSLGGSMSQIRTAASKLLLFAKQTETPVIIIGHVTKDGNIAGPKILEHMVDTVLYFEGDSALSYRILRAIKNRYGSTNEIGVFEMGQDGLKEITNPSRFFLEERPVDAPGSIVVSCVEGTRSILVELQALVANTKFGLPRRGAVGIDLNRISILLAVMERRVGMQLQGCDVYINIVGGIKIMEPASDLGIIMAVGSGYKNRPIESGIVAFGEVGLGGEVRSISLVEQRVKEASKMSFKKCIMPKKNADTFEKKVKGMEIIGVRHIGEALQYV